MNTVRILANRSWIVLFALATATPAQEKKSVHKGINPTTVAAFEKLGATYGRMEPFRFGGFDFVAGPDRAQRNLPTFRFVRNWKAKLPDVDVPFGLVIQNFGVTDAELKQAAEFKQLQMLHLGESEYLGDARRPIKVTDAGVKALAGLKQLRSLDLGYTQCTDAGLKELAGLKKLENLSLFDTQVTDAGLKELAGFRELETLNLGFTKVSDAGLKELLELKKLQWLCLSFTKVTGAGLKEVAGLKQMRELDLHRIPMTNAQLFELARLKQLQKLYLGNYNDVTDAGARELEKALPSLTIYRGMDQ